MYWGVKKICPSLRGHSVSCYRMCLFMGGGGDPPYALEVGSTANFKLVHQF